jgi:hypothetical protein
MRVFFFCSGYPNSCAWQVGKVVPTITAHPSIFFDATERAQAPGEAGEKVIPTIATPESPPNHTRMLVRHPDCHRSLSRSPIHIRNTRQARIPAQPPLQGDSKAKEKSISAPRGLKKPREKSFTL